MKNIKETEKVLKALANKRRLLVVNYLAEKDRASVGLIAEAIKLSFKSTSRHLSVLRAADIVDREQINTNVFYQLTKPLSPILKSVVSIL